MQAQLANIMFQVLQDNIREEVHVCLLKMVRRNKF